MTRRPVVRLRVVLKDGEILTRAPETSDPDEVDRRINCRRQANCVGVAMREKWKGLSCAKCPVIDPMTTEEHRQQMVCLATMLDAMWANERDEYRPRIMPSTWEPPDRVRYWTSEQLERRRQLARTYRKRDEAAKLSVVK